MSQAKPAEQPAPAVPASVDDCFAPHDERVHKVELLISNLLRAGVSASLLVVVIGTVMTFAHHPDYLSSKEELRRLTTPGAGFPHTVRDVVQGLRELQGRAVVLVGLLLLIATPVMRVAVSIFAFVYEGDRTFVFITALVLSLLILSFALGKAGG